MTRVEFQLTQEDYTEGQRAHNPMRAWGLAIFVGAIALLPLAVAVLGGESPAPSPPQAGGPGAAARAPLSDVCLPFVPWLAVFALAWLFLSRQIRRTNKPWLRKRGGIVKTDGSPAGWVVGAVDALAGLGLVFLRWKQVRAATRDPAESPLLNTLVPLVPWAVVITLLVVYFRRIPLLYRRMWQVQRHMHRPTAAEFSETGLTISEPLSRHEYRWEFFPGFVETVNLFVVYLSAVSFQLIPKRGFANESEVTAVRDLLLRRTGQPPNIGGFPVQPGPYPAAPMWASAQQMGPTRARRTPPPLPVRPPEAPVVEESPPGNIIPPSP